MINKIKFRIEVPKGWYIVWSEIMMLVGAVVSYYVMEIINFEVVTWDLWRILTNALPFYVLGRLVCLITRNVRIGLGVMLILSFLIALAMHYVWVFRGQPILPWDLKSIKTAATVAGTYNFDITINIVFAFILCVSIILIAQIIRCNECKKIHWTYAFGKILLIGWISVFYVCNIYPTLRGNLWNMSWEYTDQGIIGGFLGHLQYCFVDKPYGYVEKDVADRINNAEVTEVDGVEAENIIIIMNESLTDLRVLNNEIISDEYMPFIDSMKENTIKGNLYVPVFGANTCDSEFEVLLSASTSYTTQNPYQTSDMTGVESLVTYLSSRNYYTMAFHPYLGANWNRDVVYEKMGFDDFVSIEDMEINDSDYVRWCVSDESDYERLIEEYEKHDKGKFFMFNVTMQNHGGYTEEYENFVNTTDLSMYGEYPGAENYLTLVKESDKAFQTLIEYFAAVDEPTVICMFGDHMPALGDDFYSLMYGENMAGLSAQENQKMHITPVIIWANYDVEEKYIDKISSNFLTIEVLRAANIDLEGYYTLLNQVYEECPVVSRTGVYDRNNNWWPINELETDELILLQQNIQYYRLYD